MGWACPFLVSEWSLAGWNDAVRTHLYSHVFFCWFLLMAALGSFSPAEISFPSGFVLLKWFWSFYTYILFNWFYKFCYNMCKPDSIFFAALYYEKKISCVSKNKKQMIWFFFSLICISNSPLWNLHQ